jgi:hypothetical protein
MENTPFDLPSPVYSSVPNHGFASNPVQYRLKVRRFTKCPAEFTVQQVSFDRDLERYERCANAGMRYVPSGGPRGKRSAPPLVRDEESIERSQRRAKINIRLAVTELAPNHFVTFTTRENGPVYFKPSDWSAMWAHFIRLCRAAGIDLEYVAVLERHPSNPEHLHLHVAWRGNAHYNTLRRFWYIAIATHRGEKLTKLPRGSDTPGNILDKPVKAPRGSFKQVRKIAKYISKYITKDLISEFNKKRYWVSKGLTVEAARLFWLNGLTQAEAIREACKMLGQWDDELGLCPQNSFHPSDRIFWVAIDPNLTPPPPF